MRKSNTQPLKNVIREYIDALGHRRKLSEINILASWEKIMGKPISKHTKSLYIRKKVLYVKLDSSVLRNELVMRRTEILHLLNKHAQDNIIEKIVFQ